MDYSYPVIGIVCKHFPEVHNGSSLNRLYSLIDDEMKQAIIDVAGTPIGIVPPKRNVRLASLCRSPEECLSNAELMLLKRQLALCKGVVLQGGGRIDDYAYAIAAITYEQDIPTLGICSGQTAMARVLGAEVVKVDKATHYRAAEKYVHDIRVVPGSKFHKIVAQAERLTVNSRHGHEIIPNDRFRMAAVSPDGHAEVTEAPNKKFYIGTRFHPESLYRQDSIMRKIFEAFVEACADS